MQNEIITYTQHTGEVAARGVEAGVGSAGSPAGTGEVVRARESRGDSAQASGRSMIEMLGVLAIIGALSVGGLAALRVAQNKLRANVIINDAMLAAADVLPRLEILTPLAAGDDPVKLDFNFTPKVAHAGAFQCENGAEVIFTGISQGACQKVMQIEQIKGVAYYGVVSPSITNRDPTTADACLGGTMGGVDSCAAGDNNTLVFSVGQKGVTCGTSTCGTNEFCLVTAPTSSSTVCSTAVHTATSGACPDCHPTTQGCAQMTGDYKPKDRLTTTANGSTKHWIVSTGKMNYWSAKSWCEAQGLNLALMASVTDGCDRSVCTTDGTNVSNGGTWETDTHFYQLTQKNSSFVGSWAWLGDTYTSSNCYAYYASFNHGFVGSRYRNYGNYALCQ